MNFFEQLGDFVSTVGEQVILRIRINLLEQQCKFDEATQLAKRSLNLARKIFGNEHSEVATSLNILAGLYYSQGKYGEAEPLYQDALDMRKRLFKRDHPDVAASLNNLAFIYNNQGKYGEAEPLYQEALAMIKRLFKRDHTYVSTSLNNLASVYDNQGKYSEVESLFQETLAMRKRLFKRDHPDVATSLNNLALLYKNQGRYSEAETLLQEALAMRKSFFKRDHPDVATSLNNLAFMYSNQGKYSEAEPLLQEALAMRKRLFKRDHPDVVISLNNLASLYYSQGKHSEAEPLLQEALAMVKRLFKRDHFYVAASLNNLAYLYNNQGKYGKAEPLFQEALSMIKRLFKRDHPHVAASLNNLALLYYSQGKYSKAEPFYQEGLAMTKRLFKKDHPDVARSLNNLASLYYSQRKYSEAEPILQEVLTIRKRLFKRDHLDVTVSLNNLALIYYKREKYSEAKPLFQEALAMTKRLFKRNHPGIAASLTNLASLYNNQGKYSEAEPLFQEALGIYKCLFSGDSPDVALGLDNLASLYDNQGKYSEAEPLFEEALVMRKRLFKRDHPHVVISSNNLASIYAKTNRHQEALKLFKEATEVEHHLMNQEFLGSSENDRMLFLDNIRKTQYLLLSLVYKYFYPLEESPEKSEAIHTALDLVLKRKAISNAADAAFNAAMNSDRYPHLQDSFEKYRSLWKQIVNLQSSLYLPENLSRLEYNKDFLEKLYVEVETLQKKLSAEVSEMNLENQLVDRQTIASELPENSTLIEFAGFPVYDFTTNKYQTPRYLAFILPAKKSEKVQMIDLGEAEKIDNLISLVRLVISPINLENMGPGWKGKTSKTSKASNPSNPSNPFIELTTTVFEPLKKYLQGEKLFICPDGKLTLIPFEILPVDGENNRLLIDKYKITYLTAARDLLRHKNQPKRTASESLVIADPNFDLSVEIPPTLLVNQNLSVNLNSVKDEIIKTFGQDDKEGFLPVPMTREIAETFAAEFQVKPLLQNDALKTHLTNSKCPKKLVLATHGFFLEQNNSPQLSLEKGEFNRPLQPSLERGEFIGFKQIKAEKNPLWRSGLALAGANTWLFGGEIPPEAESGILFALDVAGLDLWANKLIILIACQTAVGDVKIGEGVKGLRSAFTAAGARLLIMSLWSVPAQVSILLMNRFLANMQQKKLSTQQALQEAQIYIKTITRTELEALPTGEKILQESQWYWQEKHHELREKWDVEKYPLQARHFWGAWVCVGREF